MIGGPLGGGPLGARSGGGGGTTIDAGGAETIALLAGSTVVVTNAPDAITEVSANRRVNVDLTGRTEIAAGVSGTVSGGNRIVIRVSTDAGATFHAFAAECAVADTSLSSATGTILGSFVGIAAEDAVDGAVLGWFTDGDATPTEDPSYANVLVVVR